MAIYHRSITQNRTRSTECVCDEVEGGCFVGFEVPKGAPGGMPVNHERIICRAVEENSECRGDYDYLQGNDTALSDLDKLPSCGSSRSSSSQEGK